MREALFIKQNLEKWKACERLETKDSDVLAEQFIYITDDLAYAKTFYPRSGTTAYLNGLSSKFHQSIYKNKKVKAKIFLSFWRCDLPILFKKHQKALACSFLFFLVFCLMGAISAKFDDTFVRLVLGDRYVNMTNENISKGDPFGVYKKSDETAMFLRIAANNIRVSIYAFVCGIFLSLGTLYILIRNGIVLGSFQYYFFSKGLGMESVMVVWIHGTLEISAIVIAGAAGLILGNSILFPGTYTRLISLQKGAKDGMKIVLSLVPVFIVAAFLEGFVTRHTEMPVWLSILILASSLAFMLWYVVIYPNVLSKQKINEAEY